MLMQEVLILFILAHQQKTASGGVPNERLTCIIFQG